MAGRQTFSLMIHQPRKQGSAVDRTVQPDLAGDLVLDGFFVAFDDDIFACGMETEDEALE